MIEVEIKLPIKDREKTEALLKKEDFEFYRHLSEKDYYFDNAEAGIRTNNQALRVRVSKNLETDETESFITFKGKKLDHVSMTRPEYESGVEKPEIIMTILHALGYSSKNSEVIKERKVLRREKMSACIDKVQGLGSFLELELVIGEGEERELALKEIEKVLEKTGYKLEDTVQTSYLTMLQKKEGK